MWCGTIHCDASAAASSNMFTVCSLPCVVFHRLHHRLHHWFHHASDGTVDHDLFMRLSRGTGETLDGDVAVGWIPRGQLDANVSGDGEWRCSFATSDSSINEEGYGGGVNRRFTGNGESGLVELGRADIETIHERHGLVAHASRTDYQLGTVCDGASEEEHENVESRHGCCGVVKKNADRRGWECL